MREIKFRGKAIEDKGDLDYVRIAHENGWVKGHLLMTRGFIEDKYTGKIYVKKYGGISSSLPGSSTYGKHHEAVNDVYVDINTVGEYTGLKDRYKKEIYEGDITTNELYQSEGLAFVVFYDTEKGMFKQRPFMYKNNGRKLGSTDLTLQMDSVENKEVIGNIHDNPELLEVERVASEIEK